MNYKDISSVCRNHLYKKLIDKVCNISITDSEGIANGSQMVVIEGKNRATITNSSLIANGLGNRNNVDNTDGIDKYIGTITKVELSYE